jgi:hypothetical protein
MGCRGQPALIDEVWQSTPVFTHGEWQTSAGNAQGGKLSPVITTFR